MDQPQPPQGPGKPFYNVLPPTRASGSFAEEAETVETKLSLPKASLSPRARLILMIAGGVIILAVIGFFVYRSLDESPAETTNAPEENQAVSNTSTPPDWQQKYFGAEVCETLPICGDTADPDIDGLANLEEYQKNSDPNNKDSDGDGLADGDEVHVFGGDPTKLKTYDPAIPYTDSDFAKGGYDIVTDKKYTEQQLAEIKAKIKQYGLHQPTITTLGAAALAQYDFVDPSGSSQPDGAVDLSGIDQSAQAKFDRDTQRLATIKKIGTGLVKYKTTNNNYPQTSDFKAMIDKVKPYIAVATNFSDPINQGKYVYGYQDTSDSQDFNLTYYSESQDQLVRYKEIDAERDTAKENAGIYDATRINDLETMYSALLTWSAKNLDTNSGKQYVFPTSDKYRTALVPDYMTSIPKDPKTKKDYAYTVNAEADSFTLKGILDAPPAGKTGYQCTHEGCDYY